jgi:hypothetical protein
MAAGCDYERHGTFGSRRDVISSTTELDHQRNTHMPTMETRNIKNTAAYIRDYQENWTEHVERTQKTLSEALPYCKPTVKERVHSRKRLKEQY